MKKKEMKMKTREEIQEEVSGSKKRSTGIHNINSNKCTSRTSRGHAYLGGGGVKPGLYGAAGISSSSTYLEGF